MATMVPAERIWGASHGEGLFLDSLPPPARFLSGPAQVTRHGQSRGERVERLKGFLLWSPDSGT